MLTRGKLGVGNMEIFVCVIFATFLKIQNYFKRKSLYNIENLVLKLKINISYIVFLGTGTYR